MSAAPLILVYGREPSLLETRRWVLERGGYRVLCAQSLAEAKHFASTEPVKLLLLCHTLTTKDWQDALAVADAVRPEMQRLLMTANTPIWSSGSRERVLNAFDGPQALLESVEDMLAATPDRA